MTEHDWELDKDEQDIDKEIADLVCALNKGGVETVSSCSGYNREYGHIWLKDGRVLIVFNPDYTKGEEIVKTQVVKLLGRKEVKDV